MTVSELIELLRTLPNDAEVVAPTYDLGADDDEAVAISGVVMVKGFVKLDLSYAQIIDLSPATDK